MRSALAGPFDLAVEPGGCAAVTGPSGAGKSLFLRMIADLDASEGAVALDGQDRASFGAPDWRRRVVYVPADAGWWADTVQAHFAAADLDGARRLALRLGLPPEVMDGPVARLSTGERQRLALVRALLLDPPVLLLDEPTGALDAASASRVERLLGERLQQGTAMVLVTHDPALAGRLATARYGMADRRLIPL